MKTRFKLKENQVVYDSLGNEYLTTYNDTLYFDQLEDYQDDLEGDQDYTNENNYEVFINSEEEEESEDDYYTDEEIIFSFLDYNLYIEAEAKVDTLVLTYGEESINREIMNGMKVEAEHSSNELVQYIIAVEHIAESYFYYKKLMKMEQKLGIEEGNE
jgi:hypothetical protein